MGTGTKLGLLVCLFMVVIVIVILLERGIDADSDDQPTSLSKLAGESESLEESRASSRLGRGDVSPSTSDSEARYSSASAYDSAIESRDESSTSRPPAEVSGPASHDGPDWSGDGFGRVRPVGLDLSPLGLDESSESPEITGDPKASVVDPSRFGVDPLAKDSGASSTEVMSPRGERNPDKPSGVEPVKKREVEIATPEKRQTGYRIYTVQTGDSLWEIAKDAYGSGVHFREILRANPGINESDLLKVGAELKLPPLSDVKKRQPKSAPVGAGEYVVVKGDSLYRIAEKLYGKGSRWGEILKLNPGLDPDRIKVGAVIKVPPKTSSD